MESNLHKISAFHLNHLLIDHTINDFEFHSAIEVDGNEKKVFDFISDKINTKKQNYDQKEIYAFLNSKLKLMEKMNLDDECCLEGKIEIKKVDIDKNIFPKSHHPKNIKNNISPRKKNIKAQSPKKSGNKNNKFIIINDNGKIEKPNSIENNLINLNVSKERQKKELINFFSDKTILDSLINEMSEVVNK